MSRGKKKEGRERERETEMAERLRNSQGNKRRSRVIWNEGTIAISSRLFTNIASRKKCQRHFTVHEFFRRNLHI